MDSATVRRHNRTMRGRLGLIGFAALLATDASAAPRRRLRLALLPVEAINLSAPDAAHYQALLSRALRALPEVALDERPVTASPGCASEIACLRDLGALLGVEKLLALRVGRLGETTVVRLTAFDVTRGARQGTWQEVLRAPPRRSDDPAVSSALDRMLAGIVPRSREAPAWYTRWWVWAVAGAVVAGSVTAAVLATRSSGSRPDLIITPP
jgi:hypothetical protein